MGSLASFVGCLNSAHKRHASAKRGGWQTAIGYPPPGRSGVVGLHGESCTISAYEAAESPVRPGLRYEAAESHEG
jgi:hypothetical protein